MHYVYVLKTKTGYYIGCTHDLRDRMKRHTSGQAKTTKDILPIELKMYFAIKDKNEAYNFEKYLKSGSGRAFTKRHFNS
ncbi:MAG: GIY-YIG nuclease family protein [Candidatus Pacebacteria bacterium]|nr:GIY-YIG nuclease family protein [Candidatus Paceibacterota bacterium]